ncbi:MAG: class II aldolase/adducin family protein [Armatimonadota bacterium]|nr:class II aldolase/adducin family protein [Armatimonadota bacterium]MDR7449610.1 class II aldolase/adducin family protein [Armatimonadota bacterium]MDR7460351.1 class II aldolase/adducin family protein [Armatimonadota bacterium]MDR7488084.1 class II aldolase/adducin family protein [Armatimonadota bacterium]MDR7492119.1 class II aldolase/adducin family protein [Armatimonadota bacterium]
MRGRHGQGSAAGSDEAAHAIRRRVALASQVLGLADHGDLVWGHVSLRDPEGRGVWMKASGWAFEEVTPARVLLVGWDGEVLAGEGRRHAEYPIHTELMRARPDVHAVVHTHAPHAVAFAALAQPLRPISHEGTLFVPPDVARFTLTGDLILTRELGQALAAAVGPRNAALMVHHGIVTVGVDEATAVLTAILLERACQKQLLAMSAGPLRTWSSPEEALAKRAHCYKPEMLQSAWAYLVRRLSPGAAGRRQGGRSGGTEPLP